MKGIFSEELATRSHVAQHTSITPTLMSPSPSPLINASDINTIFVHNQSLNANGIPLTVPFLSLDVEE